MTSLSETLTLSPAVWPGPPLKVQPGDLTKFVPSGLGLNAPPMMMPWDTLESALGRGNYYGFDEPSLHPFRNAPVNDDVGGVLYFGGRPDRAELEAALRLLHVGNTSKRFLAFYERSANPLEDRYVEQLRLMAPHSLGLFGSRLTPETEALAAQTVSLTEAFWRFVEYQQAVHGDGMYPRSLAGALGGDGDWAKEALAFGFLVENAYHGIYRIWSRAWLVTK